MTRIIEVSQEILEGLLILKQCGIFLESPPLPPKKWKDKFKTK